LPVKGRTSLDPTQDFCFHATHLLYGSKNRDPRLNPARAAR